MHFNFMLGLASEKIKKKRRKKKTKMVFTK